MKAYVDPIPPTLSKSIHRLADALTKYAPPSVQIVSDYLEADFLLCHMIGQEGWDPYLEMFASRRYGVWQHCLKTTRHPNPNDWAGIWQHADIVASCYDLRGMWTEAQIPPDTMEARYFRTPNFVRLPLGVGDSFRRCYDPESAEYLVTTSGYVAGMEIIEEWGKVCRARKKLQFHLGPWLKELPREWCHASNGISDLQLAQFYSQSMFVSGLRRSEGFELPAFEGLACGARPVMFDREDARHWLGDHAEYIQEGSSAEVEAQLYALVSPTPHRDVTPDEIQWVRDTFSWEKIAREFWKKVGV